MNFRTCFMFRNPQPKTMRVQEIFRPFNLEIWHSISLIIGICIIILTFVSKSEETSSGALRLSNSFIIAIGAMCQQGKEQNTVIDILMKYKVAFKSEYVKVVR